MIIVIHPKTYSQHSIVSWFCFFWDALDNFKNLHTNEYSLSHIISTFSPPLQPHNRSHVE